LSAREADPSRPNLLFLTPTLPHTTGTGSAIRAGVALQTLSRHFNVYVLHANLWAWHSANFHTEYVERHSIRYVQYERDNGDLPMPQILNDHFAGVRFQAIHTFRLSMARAALAVVSLQRGHHTLAVIDLDDDECQRSERFFELREEAGETVRAEFEREELPRLRTWERMLVPRFQSICLAAEQDCKRIAKRYAGASVTHLPNAVFLPRATPPPRSLNAPHVLLFVGTLDYLPNEDGVHYFCTRILPLVRQRCSEPVRVRLVGANPAPRVTQLGRNPDVEVLANVPDLAPYYAEAAVVVVPLRAGSGTRIKILEAFGYRRPVVSTTIGAEGLGVTNGEQLLIADDPEPFAEGCVRLLEDSTLSAALTASARDWLLANHSLDRVESVIRSLYEPVLKRYETMTPRAWPQPPGQ
jgi:glycosyltransferase involved in cell wall biosynthesis